MGDCELRKANGIEHVACDGNGCVYWCVLEHLDLPMERTDGCAIQSFDLLAAADDDLAAWLLSVKMRVEEGRA